jgi:biopolymer transport protein TolQ
MMRVKIQPRLNVFCRLQPSTSANGDRGRNGAVGRKEPFRSKGLCMKVRRLAASALAAILLVAAVDAGGSAAFAQLQPRQSTGQGRPPIAAPTGQGAESAPLAAPSGDVQAALVGPQSETAATFTPVGLFIRADFVVKSVLVLLILASFWSWVLIIDKWFAIGTLKRKASRFEKTFWSGRSLDELYAQHSQRSDQPFTAVFVAALREWKRSFEGGVPRDALIPGVKERVEKAMSVSIHREIEKIERGLGYLATVGSTAPFVGLFGTVWGIMNSFQAIAQRQDTTLAVVAPGIAEALFATALGLLAAIPAVIAYNRFVNEVGRYENRLEAFADEFSAFLSRQLDERSR